MEPALSNDPILAIGFRPRVSETQSGTPPGRCLGNLGPCSSVLVLGHHRTIDPFRRGRGAESRRRGGIRHSDPLSLLTFAPSENAFNCGSSDLRSESLDTIGHGRSYVPLPRSLVFWSHVDGTISDVHHTQTLRPRRRKVQRRRRNGIRKSDGPSIS